LAERSDAQQNRGFLMKILVAGATGAVGSSLVPQLLKNQHEIIVLGRDPAKITRTFNNAVTAITGSQLNTISPEDVDAIINLTGETISQLRWTENIKQRIMDSRILATNNLLAWCASAINKPHLYNASAIGTYGLQATQNALPPRLTESSAIPFGHPTDFLSTVGQAWETAAQQATTQNQAVTIMRFGVVLKKQAGILKKLAPAFALGMGSVMGSGQQAFTWIQIDDLVAAIIFLLNHPEITGAVNLCAPECVSQKQFAKTLANVMRKPLFITMPDFLIKMLFGQMGEELLLGGQNIYPERLLKLGFNFTHSDINSALQQELALTAR
jgi:uncharacterized protein (TIGR01777 family)